jgi:hypothetical protein
LKPRRGTAAVRVLVFFSFFRQEQRRNRLTK